MSRLLGALLAGCTVLVLAPAPADSAGNSDGSGPFNPAARIDFMQVTVMPPMDRDLGHLLIDRLYEDD